MPVCAAPQDVKLPPESIRLRPSDLPGYKIAMQKCAVCHSTDYISYQPPAMSLAQWTAEMTKMQRGYGAPISDAEVKQLAAYLAVAYGSAKASDPDVVAVVKEAASGPGR
jgi:mono/diheme cytochrome c family protein